MKVTNDEYEFPLGEPMPLKKFCLATGLTRAQVFWNCADYYKKRKEKAKGYSGKRYTWKVVAFWAEDLE